MSLLRCISIFVRMCVTEAESMATAASRSPQYVRGGLHALYDLLLILYRHTRRRACRVVFLAHSGGLQGSAAGDLSV